MIVFFTFLTFYSAYFDKVRDCGCFGDALKLTPWESFSKDVVLLVFVLILFFGVKHIKPFLARLPVTVLALAAFIFCFWFAYHVLMHLPVVDFRGYHVGANIQESMRIPDDAPKPVVEYAWKFNVDGKDKIVTTHGAYPSVKGDFVSVDTKVIDNGYQPPIYDFSIETDDDDLTDYFLNLDHLVIVVSYSLDHLEKQGALKLKGLQDKAQDNGYQIIGLTASGDADKQRINKTYDLDFKWYLCDEKALKTVVRSNPGILVLNKGTIMQKKHWNDIEDLQLPKVETPQSFEENNKEHILYLIDGKISTKEEVDALENTDTVKQLKFTIQKHVLDSLNKARNSNYVGFMNVELKKE